MLKRLRSRLSSLSRRQRLLLLAELVLLCGLAGLFLARFGSAAIYQTVFEAEAGSPGGNVRQDRRDDASGGAAMRFASDSATPQLAASVLVDDRIHVWDLAFLPDRSILFTERGGALSRLHEGRVTKIADMPDVASRGEGGLMGLALDPQYASNNFAYTCYNSTAGDVRVVRWKLAGTPLTISDRKDIITGMPAQESGRHSGCRTVFGPDGYLWVGTGDAALGDSGQQPMNLGGKILRVDRDGRAAPGNLGGAFDARVYSYGHRNTQGLAFFPVEKRGTLGLSSEHGSSVDDEINELRRGNYGWAPPSAGYSEGGVPMTDTQRFPDAIGAIWSSGSPTQAPSGMAIVNGAAWKGWDGTAAVAMLKARHLKILRLDAANKVVREERALEGAYGRLRAVVQGPDGALYVTTDNGGGDKIVRIAPQ